MGLKFAVAEPRTVTRTALTQLNASQFIQRLMQLGRPEQVKKAGAI